MNLDEAVMILDQYAPRELAEEWDNIGLMIGRKNQEIKRILVALDLDDAVLEEAIEKNADLIVTHHPVIFAPLKKITRPVLLGAIRHDIAVYSAHTNLDVAQGGVNDVLADILGICNARPFGLIRYGTVPKQPLADLIEGVKKALDTPAVRVQGGLAQEIEQVAVLGGSGGDYLKEVKDLGCQLLITGELSYHEAQEAKEMGLCVIAAGHFETEHWIAENLAKRLERQLNHIMVSAASQPNLYQVR